MASNELWPLAGGSAPLDWECGILQSSLRPGRPQGQRIMLGRALRTPKYLIIVTYFIKIFLKMYVKITRERQAHKLLSR